MTSRYIFNSLMWIGTTWYWSIAFCGPIWLAPEPIVHDRLEHGFFVREFMQKRPSLLKAVGSYPAMVIGGRVESLCIDRLPLNISPMVDTILINMVLCLDHHALLLLPFKYDATNRKEAVFSLNQFALILGKHSKYNIETDIGGLRLPFRVYGAIGQFLSPALPLDSKIFSSRGVAPLTTEVARHNLRSVPSLLVGIQKDYGPNSLSAVLVACNLSRKSTKPKLITNVEYTFFGRKYELKGSGSYDTTYQHGTICGTMLHNDYNIKLSIQQMFGCWWIVDESKNREGRWAEKTPGQLEVNWDVKMPSLKAPATLAVGYGWSSKLSFKKGGNAMFGGLGIAVTKYAKIDLGLKLKARDLSLKGLMMRIDIVF